MLSGRERIALIGLAKVAERTGEDFGYCTFKGIAEASGLEQRHVRRTVRALARKGFARYARGLWTENDEMFGSGYCITTAGIAALEAAP